MPQMDGFEASEKILSLTKEAGEPDHTRIVALTSFSSKDTYSRALSSGMKDLLNKPLNHSDLQRMVFLHFFRMSLNELNEEQPQLKRRKTLHELF